MPAGESDRASDDGTPDASTVLRRRSQHEKQVMFGKSTPGYLNYALHVLRSERSPDHPTTPRFNAEDSKRKREADLKRWRRDLHRYDPEKNYFSSAAWVLPLTPSGLEAPPEPLFRVHQPYAL